MKKIILLLAFTLITIQNFAQEDIDHDENWQDYSFITQHPDFAGGITVTNNATLTISNHLIIQMYPNAIITVKAGSILRITESTIRCSLPTNSWKGIIIEGQKLKPQSFLKNDNGQRSQGLVILKGTQNPPSYTCIENAQVGVQVNSGGILLAYNTVFSNCPFGVHILSYSSGTMNNKCSFDECIFKWSRTGSLYNYNAGQDPMASTDYYRHIWAENVNGLKILGCEFISYLTKGLYNVYHSGNYPRGAGIYLTNSSLIVQRSEYWTQQHEFYEFVPPPCLPPNGKKCLFKNLYFGVHLANDNNLTPSNCAKVYDCKFENVDLPFRLINSIGSQIYKNKINLYNWTTCDFIGIKIDESVGYTSSNNKIVENRFEISDDSNITGAPLIENHLYILINSINSETNEIYKNEFYYLNTQGISLPPGSITNGIQINAILNKGAGYIYNYNINCNTFKMLKTIPGSPVAFGNDLEIRPDNYNNGTINIGSSNLPARNSFLVSYTYHLKGLSGTTSTYYYTPTCLYQPIYHQDFTLTPVSSWNCPCPEVDPLSCACPTSFPCIFYPKYIDFADPSRLIVGSGIIPDDIDDNYDHPWDYGSSYDPYLDDPTPGFIQAFAKSYNTSILEITSDVLIINPNPANNEITFSFDNIENSNIQLFIYNSMGKEIYKSSVQNKKLLIMLDKNTFQTRGIYFAAIKSNNKIIHYSKVIIN